jgi:hypothetical protein
MGGGEEGGEQIRNGGRMGEDEKSGDIWRWGLCKVWWRVEGLIRNGEGGERGIVKVRWRVGGN